MRKTRTWIAPLVAFNLLAVAVLAVAPPPAQAATSVTNLTLTVNPTTAGSTATYTSGFDVTTALTGGTDTITFQSTVFNPGGTGCISAFPSAAGDYVVTDQTTPSGSGTVARTPTVDNGYGTSSATFTVPNNIKAGDALSIVVQNVTNPDQYSCGGPLPPYTFTFAVSTSQDTTPATTSYTITANTSVSGVTVSLGSATAGQPSSYTVGFTATDGVADGSNIYLQFPSGTSVPTTLAGSDVAVDGTAVTGTVSVSGTTLSFASPVSVSNGGTVTAAIYDNGAGHTVTNPQTTGSSYSLGVYTAADPNSVQSSPYTITPAAASQLAFTAQPGGGPVGSAWSAQPAVIVQDAYGNTVTSAVYSINLSITSGTGTAGAALTCTADPLSTSSGLASFSGCWINQAGSGYTLTAAATGLASAVSSSFNVVVSVPTKLVFLLQPGGGTAGSAWATQPEVAVEDAYGNTVTSGVYSVALSITSGTGSAGAVLTCAANPMNTSSGVAAFSGCGINQAGSGYTLTVAASGLTSGTSASFTVTLVPTGGGGGGGGATTIPKHYPDNLAGYQAFAQDSAALAAALEKKCQAAAQAYTAAQDALYQQYMQSIATINQDYEEEYVAMQSQLTATNEKYQVANNSIRKAYGPQIDAELRILGYVSYANLVQIGEGEYGCTGCYVNGTEWADSLIGAAVSSCLH
ncbi:MAG: hypothetical protein M0Z27_01140, partial [Thermaerobacter sp.]|nr:hypothetical protein [Thermaerobacter sp.]